MSPTFLRFLEGYTKTICLSRGEGLDSKMPLIDFFGRMWRKATLKNYSTKSEKNQTKLAEAENLNRSRPTLSRKANLKPTSPELTCLVSQLIKCIGRERKPHMTVQTKGKACLV